VADEAVPWIKYFKNPLKFPLIEYICLFVVERERTAFKISK
jgi:hypothetical protein